MKGFRIVSRQKTYIRADAPSTVPASDQPSSPRQRSQSVRRRQLLATSGTLLVAGLAGCRDLLGDSDGDQSGDTPTQGPDTPPGADQTPTETSGTRTPLNGPWPTAHADAANTGTVEAAGPRGTPSVHWQEHVDLNTTVRAAVGPDGPVATQFDGTVIAYDAGGDVRWRREHDAEFAAAPVVAADGTVVVGRRDGAVLAYEGDGTERWRQDTPDGLFAPHVNDATPFRLAGGTAVLAHPQGRTIAYDLADGSVRWDVSAPTRGHRPAIASGRVFLTGDTRDHSGSVVQSLSLSDGAILWRTETNGSISIGAGVHDGFVYTADIDGRVVARDVEDGAERWRVRLDGGPWVSTIPVVVAGRVWVGTLSEGLYAVTEDGVAARVQVATPTTPAVGDGRLYVGSSDFGRGAGTGGAVVAIESDGTERWRVRTRGFPESQLHYRDRQVVVGTNTGVVARLGADDGTRAWRAFERPDRLPAPVVGPATVYCGSRGNAVGGYRVTDGTSHLWSVGLDGPSPGTSTVAGRTVIAGSRGGDVAGTPPLEFADRPDDRLTRTPTPGPDATPTPHIDAEPPDPRWRTRLDGPVGDFGHGDGYLYVGSGSAVVSMTADGDVRWETDVGGSVRGAPAVAGSDVYAATTDGEVVTLAAVDGTEQWRQTVGTAATAPSLGATGGSGQLVVGTETAIVVLDPEHGSERWRTGTGHVRGTPATAGDTVVAGDDTGVLRGLAASDGAEQWRADVGGPVHGSLAVADGIAYVGSRDRHLYAVAVDDGTVDWRLELPDWVDGSPAVAYGAVFVVDQSGSLSAVVGER